MIDANDLMEEKIQEIVRHANITVFTQSRVTAVQGFIGKFEADIETQSGVKKIDIGVILMATGGNAFVPEGLYGYDGQRVITQLEMEQLLKNGLDSDIKNVVMIQCVGSRNQERPYCSRICCQTAVKNAILIKDQNPDTRVSIIYRDMQMYGVENEEMFRDSKAKGVRYIHYDPARPPQMESDQVRVYHSLLGREMALPMDLVEIGRAHV